MTTYNTFAECLKNHPTEKVMTTGREWVCSYEAKGKFSPMNLPDGGNCHVEGEMYWVEANPADHLMTLEEFFNGGYEFESGDSYIDKDGSVVTLCGRTYPYGNRPMRHDNDRFILSASCFGGGSHPVESKAVEVNVKEEPDLIEESSPSGVISRISNRIHNIGCELQDSPLGDELAGMACEMWDVLKVISNEPIKEPIPRMRTEYVKDERSINEIAKAMIDGEVFYRENGTSVCWWDDGTFKSRLSEDKETDFSYGVTIRGDYFKKVQTPIDERQEFIDAMCEAVPEFDRRTAPMWMGKLYDAGFRKPE